VLAPEHALVQELRGSIENWDEVLAYIEVTKAKKELERKEGKEKTGVELKGVHAINPANGEEVPVWIADYVLGGYGSFGSILEDEKYILMQYTGLKDKNGKEIYEGDIVIDYSDTDVKYYVRYDTFKARFVLQSDIPEGYYGFDVLKTMYSYELHKDLSEEKKLKLGTRLVDIEVIGNIYDTQV
jgi:uncharacterized phage protein (TIGR01671 family)